MKGPALCANPLYPLMRRPLRRTLALVSSGRKPQIMTSAASGPAPRVPLVVHVVDRLGVGGMENGLVNIINGTPPNRLRHAVVCLREAGAFQKRLTRDDVPVRVLGKSEGKDIGCYWRLWRELRRLRPDIVHTRNLPAVDMVVPAAFCGARAVVHGEHGRDAVEEDGKNRRYNFLRRSVSPCVDRYVVVSRDIGRWLVCQVGVPGGRVVQIYNGVDAARFRPPGRLLGPAADAEDLVVFGTVGRMQTVKDQVTLARAFVRLVDHTPGGRERLRLVLIGDGPLRDACRQVLAEAGMGDLAWMPGTRHDVPDLLRRLDVFVLPSRTEGICNTILEAMATGLPVIATNVGGNPELVLHNTTGFLVPHSDPDAMARAMDVYAIDALARRTHGAAGRARVLSEFALERMVERYLMVYEGLLARRKGRRRGDDRARAAAVDA